jgi:hypothetical protein
MSDSAYEEAARPVDLGISEGKALGFAPTAVAGPMTWPIGGINNPMPTAAENGSPVDAGPQVAPEPSAPPMDSGEDA